MLKVAVALLALVFTNTAFAESAHSESHLRYIYHPVFGDQVTGEFLDIQSSIHLYEVWSSSQTKLCYVPGKQKEAITQLETVQARFAEYGHIAIISEDPTVISAQMAWNWESTESELTLEIPSCPKDL